MHAVDYIKMLEGSLLPSIDGCETENTTFINDNDPKHLVKITSEWL